MFFQVVGWWFSVIAAVCALLLLSGLTLYWIARGLSYFLQAKDMYSDFLDFYLARCRVRWKKDGEDND